MAKDKLGQDLQVGDFIMYTVFDDLRPAIVRKIKQNKPSVYGTHTYQRDDTVYVLYPTTVWNVEGGSRIAAKKGHIMEYRKILKVPEGYLDLIDPINRNVLLEARRGL